MGVVVVIALVGVFLVTRTVERLPSNFVYTPVQFKFYWRTVLLAVGTVFLVALVVAEQIR